jgi:hypothetical protein
LDVPVHAEELRVYFILLVPSILNVLQHLLLAVGNGLSHLDLQVHKTVLLLVKQLLLLLLLPRGESVLLGLVLLLLLIALLLGLLESGEQTLRAGLELSEERTHCVLRVFNFAYLVFHCLYLALDLLQHILLIITIVIGRPIRSLLSGSSVAHVHIPHS